jgi:outer membrane receptor protein involved in Fe transport
MLRWNRLTTGRWLPLVAALALAIPAAAQVNTGTIEVVTTDQQGAALPGVTVLVRNADTGLQRIGIADASGISIFLALPPGPYVVGADLEGFASIVDQPLVLRIGQTARIEFTMQVQVSETITVTAEVPLVDVLKIDSSTNIVPEQIANLPVPDRNFENLAFIAPTVQRERGPFRFIQNSPVVGAGGNASHTSILVDGADFTDTTAGLSRARFSQDAIQEFRVIAGRFDTEVGGSQGGALSVITRSGTNELHGSAFGFFRDASLRETGALEEQNDDFERQQLGFTIGGPIAQDKTHYFLSLEYIDVTDIAPFRPGGAFADLATNFGFPTEQTLGLVSFNHQFSASSSGFLKGVYERFRQENFRVGGTGGSAVQADESNGQQLNRDNWNIVLGHTKVFGDGNKLNEARLQFGVREYEEPTNSDVPEEWFSLGNTLRTGMNSFGHIAGKGDYWEIRDTFHLHTSGAKSSHDWKFGGAWFRTDDRFDFPYFAGTMFYLTDDRSIPLLYIYATGSGDKSKDTDLLSVFAQDAWRAAPNVTLSFGLRYDYDTDGNSPDFEHSLVGDRSVDDDNFQPRIGFSWDINNDGKSVLRGGAGVFVGRTLLIPAFAELQQNGETGRIVRQNLSFPPFFPLDPADPENTGFPLPVDSTLIEDSLEAPESWQASLGFTKRLANTGLYLDLEGLYAEGDDEIFVRDTNWNGNDNPTRPNPDWNQINMYTNDGHSEYWAGIVSLNGTFGRGHMLTSSVTFMDKKNLSDDFSPVFPDGYPNDPADPEGEWGRGRGQEDLRVVMAGVFNLPGNFTLGATWQYGDGQPWNRILGYDANGDGKNSDRAPGVPRNGEDGPSFSSLSLRLSWSIPLGGTSELDLIAEAFNLTDETNFDVTSVENNEFLVPGLPNPAFGEYTKTLPPREFQLGVRYRF